MQTLKLTSPPTRGNEVKAAQKALKAYGTWVGKIDGVFGERTARAAAQAKYQLGYPKKDCTQVYGAMLHAYLTGKKKPNLIMQRRAKQRVPHTSLREVALKEALKWVGTKESPPNSNKVVFSDWYGLRGPWCAMFVTWCFVKAGSKVFDPSKARWAYCPYMVNDARRQQNGLVVVPLDQVEAGDIAMFDWQGDGTSDHTGIVRTKPNKFGDFQCVEGNTSVSSNSDGGAVMIRDRNKKHVQVFIRVVG